MWPDTQYFLYLGYIEHVIFLGYWRKVLVRRMLVLEQPEMQSDLQSSRSAAPWPLRKEWEGPSDAILHRIASRVYITG